MRRDFNHAVQRRTTVERAILAIGLMLAVAFIIALLSGHVRVRGDAHDCAGYRARTY